MESKLEAAGIEPASNFDAAGNGSSSCENGGEACAARALHPSVIAQQSLSLDDAAGHCECAARQIESVVKLWPHLPQHVRETILLLVQAASCE